eukprot:375477-Amorphochlora_amoeboformis.AAC.1
MTQNKEIFFRMTSQALGRPWSSSRGKGPFPNSDGTRCLRDKVRGGGDRQGELGRKREREREIEVWREREERK